MFHEDKRPGTRLVLYTNSCPSNGKSWKVEAVGPNAVKLVSTLNGFVATVEPQPHWADGGGKIASVRPACALSL